MKRYTYLYCPTLCMILFGAAPRIARADDPMVLRESFPPGYAYHVSCRVELGGNLQLPPAKGAKEAKALKVTGTSVIEYDERVLESARDNVTKTLRSYRTIDFKRRVGEDLQESTIRPQVRLMVLMRLKQAEVPFSQNGPMTWPELDLVRTDVFTPALAGMLPDRPVRPSDRWTAATAAVQELTDMERIEDGKIDCELEQVTEIVQRKHARVGFKGWVRGVNEDGPNRQEIEGFFLFDLLSRHISYVSLRGVQSLLEPDGTSHGRIEGQFVLTRRLGVDVPELSDTAMAGRRFEPNDDNTQLLYQNFDLGFRLLYPRRWRVGVVQGRQVTIDEANGSGLLLTLDQPNHVPTDAQFFGESREELQKQKVRILREDRPRRLQEAPREIEHFAFQAEAAGRPFLMDYYVVRQAGGGATLAARLAPRDQAILEREVAGIARSLVIDKGR